MRFLDNPPRHLFFTGKGGVGKTSIACTTAVVLARRGKRMTCVACHEHGTGVAGFLPGSWDHLDCQSWDHPACRAGGSWVSSLDRRVGVAVMEVYGRGIQGGQCG